MGEADIKPRRLAKITALIILSNLLLSNFGTDAIIPGWSLRTLDATFVISIVMLPLLLCRSAISSLYPLTRFAGVFLGVVFVSTFLSIVVFGSIPVEEIIRIIRAVVRLAEVLLLAIVLKMALTIDRYLIQYAIRAAILLLSVQPAYSIYLYFVSPEQYTRIGGFVAVGTAGEGIIGVEQANFNELGAFCACGLVLTIYEIIKGKGLVKRGALICLLGVFVAGALLTGSRSALGSAVAGVLVQMVAFRGARRLLLGLVLGIAVAFYAIIFDATLILSRIIETFNMGSADNLSAMGRLDATYTAWLIFCEYPIFGVGYAAFRNFNDAGYITPESYYMEMLADLGIVGVSLWAWYILVLGRRMWLTFYGSRGSVLTGLSGSREDVLARQLLPCIVCLLVGNISGNNFFDPSLLLLFLFLCGAAEVLCFVGHPSSSTVGRRLNR